MTRSLALRLILSQPFVLAGGAGGKGTWGKLGCELELPWVDPNDPNYESDKDEVSCLNPPQFFCSTVFSPFGCCSFSVEIEKNQRQPTWQCEEKINFVECKIRLIPDVAV